MPLLRDLVSKYILTPSVVESLKPEVRRLLAERLPNAVKEAAVMGKLEGDVPSSPYKILSQGPIQPYTLSTGARKSGTGVSFSLLREFSVFYWAVRACISKRQEQIANLEWDIVPDDGDDDSEATSKRAMEVQQFFSQIGGAHRTFRHFLDMLVEDLLVLDAMAAYKVRENSGKLIFLHPVDGATIRLVVDKAGILLQPPAVAYEQYVRGQKVASMTGDELIYGMMNPRTNSAYGLSPLESLILVVQSALHSEVSNLNVFKEGNVPEGFIQTPEGWGPKEIEEFQKYWDAIMAGDMAMQRRLRAIPGGKGAGYIAAKKPVEMEFQKFEEWMTIKTCALFGVSPQAIGITWDVNKATAEEQSTLARNESIRPLANFLIEKFNSIIHADLGQPDLHFVFRGFDTRDEKLDAEISQMYVNMGVKNVNEVRAELGQKPIPGGDKYFVMTAAGPVLLEDLTAVKSEQPSQPPQGQEPTEEVTAIEEIRRYQKKALNDVRREQPFRKFASTILTPETIRAVENDLQNCKTAPEVRAMFNKYIREEQGQMFEAAMTLSDELEKIFKQPDHGHKIIKIAKSA